MSRYECYKEKLIKLKTKKEEIEKNIKELTDSIKDIIEKKDIIEEAHFIAQLVGRQTQQKLEYGLSELPSDSLSSVYKEPYRFQV